MKEKNKFSHSRFINFTEDFRHLQRSTMSLKCLNAQCADHELATADQLAFYQDVGGGWNLSIGPPYDVSKGNLPPHFLLIQHDGDARCKFVVFCNRCRAKLGKVTKVQGFHRLTANFSTKYVRLLPSRDSDLTEKAPKWAAIVDLFPQIRRFTAMKNSRHAKPSGINTEHYRGLEDMQEMIENGRAVAARSNLLPRRYQWRAYFMACLKNVLLCLPLGMGKTLVANMLMLAYRQLNPNKGQVVVVPSVALVSLMIRWKKNYFRWRSLNDFINLYNKFYNAIIW